MVLFVLLLRSLGPVLEEYNLLDRIFLYLTEPNICVLCVWDFYIALITVV